MGARVAQNGTPLSARRCYLMSANVTCIFTRGAWVLFYVPSEEEQVGDVYQEVHPPVGKTPRKGRALQLRVETRSQGKFGRHLATSVEGGPHTTKR